MTQPHSIEAEKIVLGTILMYPDSIPVAIQDLKPEMFHSSDNQIIYSAMAGLFSKGIGVDVLTVYEEVRKKLNPFSPAELTKLTNGIYSANHLDHHIQIVKDKYLKRELIKAAMKTAGKASSEDGSAEEIISSHNAEIYNLNSADSKDRSIEQLLADVTNDRKNRKQGLRGYPMGYLCLDSVLNGLMPTDLTIIAGRPGQGKTAFAINILKHITIKKQIPSLYVSLEMGADQIFERLESCVSGLDHSKLSENSLEEYEQAQLSHNHNLILNSPIHIIDPARIDINQLRAKISLFKARHDIKVCFIDYLQLVAGTGRKDGYETITEVSKGLKAIAREFKVSMVCLAQLSREVEKRPDKMPQLSDLKESGQIEQDADRVIFLMRPEYYGHTKFSLGENEPEQPSEGKIIMKIAKNRHGSLGHNNGKNILNWQPHIMRVVEFEETPF